MKYRLILAILALASNAFCENGTKLSLDAALSEALKNNPALMADSAEAEAAAARVASAASLEDPELGLRASNYPVTDFSARKFEMTGNEISISQKFPFPGKRALLEKTADYKYEAQTELTELSKLELIRAVKGSFFGLYLAQELLNTQHEKVSLLEQARALAIKKLPLSQVSQDEVTSLEIEAARADAELGVRLSKFSRSQALLNHLLGRTSHQLAERLLLPKRTNAALANLKADNLIEAALLSNPKVRALRKIENAQQSEVAYKNLNTMPDIETMLSYTQRDSMDAGNGEDFVSAGVTVNVPLWAADKQYPERIEAKAMLLKARKLREEEENHLRHYISDLVSELSALNRSLESYTKSILPLLDQSSDLALRSYSSGQEKYSSLLEKINSRFQSEEEYNQILVEFESKRAELEYFTGAALDE